jgi:queuine/archaeosine tRNA-ribosyltransferase
MTHKEASGCALMTVHNVAFQLRLMKNIRQAIKEDRWDLRVIFIVSRWPNSFDIFYLFMQLGFSMKLTRFSPVQY